MIVLNAVQVCLWATYGNYLELTQVVVKGKISTLFNALMASGTYTFLQILTKFYLLSSKSFSMQKVVGGVSFTF